MGRSVAYDRNEVLRGATELFRKRPFRDVSVEEIVRATRINRFAIYEKFGGKAGLFYACLENYLDGPVKRELLGSLAGQSAGLGELIDVLGALRRRNLDPELPAGCLIVNASIEFGGGDERVEQIARAYWGEMRRVVSGTLARARERGELGEERSVEELSEYLIAMLDAFMTLRHVSRPSAERFMAVVIAEVERWNTTPERMRFVV